MYREDVIPLIQKGEDVKHNTEILYSANLGVFYKLGTQFGRGQVSYDDLMQIAYLSLVKALELYSVGGRYTFLSYFRKCYFHDCFIFRMENCYPFRLNQNTYKTFSSSGTEYFGLQWDLPVMELEFERIEQAVFSKTLWDAVECILDSRGAYVVLQHYKHEREYRDIAVDLHTSASSVKQCCFRAITKLRRNRIIIMLAKDYLWI